MNYEEARKVSIAVARRLHKKRGDWQGAVRTYIDMMCDLGHPTNNYEEGLAGSTAGGESTTRRMLRTGR